MAENTEKAKPIAECRTWRIYAAPGERAFGRSAPSFCLGVLHDKKCNTISACLATDNPKDVETLIGLFDLFEGCYQGDG
jgi:hypothetical protein